MWAFKRLWDKGLVYEAYRVMPYSWGAETPLANFEIRLDDAMRPRQDPALTVRFRLVAVADDGSPVSPGPCEAWAWTTTPWTLPVESRPHGRPRRRLRRRRIAHERGQRRCAVRADRGVGRRTLRARTRRRRPRSVPRWPAPISPGARTRHCFPYFADHADAFRILADRLRRRRRRHRHRAHRARPRRGRPAGRRRQRHHAGVARRRRGPLHRRDRRHGGRQRLRREPGHHPPPPGRAQARRGTTPSITTTRTAGGPTHRSSTRRCRAGTCGSPISRIVSSNSTRTSTGFPIMFATASSDDGSKAPATGRSRATASGALPSRSGDRTIPTIPEPTCTGRSTRSKPTSGSASTISTGR